MKMYMAGHIKRFHVHFDLIAAFCSVRNFTIKRIYMIIVKLNRHLRSAAF